MGPRGEEQMETYILYVEMFQSYNQANKRLS